MNTIETEPMNRSALTRYNGDHQALATTAHPLTGQEMIARLALIQDVMRTAMKESQDYGKVPGCGDRNCLFQPGAQKLSMMFQLNPEVQEETITDYPNYHRGFRLVVRVSAGGKFADGVGECSTLETKYRYRSGQRKCPQCGKETIIKGKAEYGGGWICFQRKGGCGAKWNDGDKAIEEQQTGKIEHDNPPDFWNTARKMAFKRAFVHAIINATNTSELWSQDLEDLAANGVMGDSPSDETHTTPKQQNRPEPTKQAASAPSQLAQKAQPPQAGEVIEECTLTDFKEKSGEKNGKPWTMFICAFESGTGDALEATSFDKKLGDVLPTLQGAKVQLRYKPGFKPGKYDIVSIQPADDVQM